MSALCSFDSILSTITAKRWWSWPHSSAAVSCFGISHFRLQQDILLKQFSYGSRDLRSFGKKFQFFKISGRHSGFLFCIMFTMMTKISVIDTGMRTPIKMYHPAKDKAKIVNGRTMKIRTRYTPANHLCLAVNLANFFARVMGIRRMNGIG